jgi:hypothetical protein
MHVTFREIRTRKTTQTDQGAIEITGDQGEDGTEDWNKLKDPNSWT